MKQIEGVNLEEEVRRAEAAALEESRAKVGRMVRGVMDEIIKYTNEIQEQEKALAKSREKLTAAINKRQKLIEGDWSILNENMLKSQPTSERG